MREREIQRDREKDSERDRERKKYNIAFCLVTNVRGHYEKVLLLLSSIM